MNQDRKYIFCKLLMVSIIFLLMLNFQQQYVFSQENSGSYIIGNKYSINSSILKSTRHFFVYLPPFYGETSVHYPLLVILDGGDFFHFITGVLDYYTKLGKIPGLLAVGIESSDRWRDYTPTRADIPDGTALPTSGGADKFHEFITAELLPYINSKFRITPFHILYGHSIAGLFVVNSLLAHPENFSGFIATSPSLWWDNEISVRQLEKRLRGHKSDSFHRYLFITIGNEGETMSNPITHFTKALEKYTPGDITWKFRHFAEVDHQTMPVKAFVYGLESIFSDWLLPEEILAQGLSAVTNYYEHLSKKYRTRIEVSEGVLNRLGYMAMKKGNIDLAIEVFRLNARKYPRSANVYDSLGEAYLKKGERSKAIENYQKSLELNPRNDNAKKMLKELEN